MCVVCKHLIGRVGALHYVGVQVYEGSKCSAVLCVQITGLMSTVPERARAAQLLQVLVAIRAIARARASTTSLAVTQ